MSDTMYVSSNFTVKLLGTTYPLCLYWAYTAIHESLNDYRILRSNLRFFLNKNLTEIEIKIIFFFNLINRLFVNRIKKSRFRLITVYSEISLKGR